MASRLPYQPQPTGAWPWFRRRWVGVSFTAASVAAVVYIAVRSTTTTPVTGAEAGLATFIAAVTNLLGVYAFARVGRADPTLARSAVRRLVTIAYPLGVRVRSMGKVFERNQPAEVMGEAQVMVGEVTMALYGLQDAIADWNEVHGEALAEVLKGTEQLTEGMWPIKN